MRIGIVGAGVSGMAAAWMLQHDHQVNLIERSARPGGHVETLPVTLEGRTVHAELGTRFFFDTAYPHFLALLRLLGVPIRWNAARVAVIQRDRTIVLPPRSPRQVFALLRSPRLVRHVRSLQRLIDEQPAVSARQDMARSFRRHLAEGGYPPSFGPELIYPFLSACWGAPLDRLPDFPVYSLLKGMPSGKAPGFYDIPGGMERYVRRLADELAEVRIRLGAGVRKVTHSDEGYELEDERGERMHVDHLIVATSSRDAANLLRGVSVAAEMHALVERFRHFETEIVIHGDPGFMPKHRGDWAHNNLFLDGPAPWMTDWQGLREDLPVFRSWLPEGHAPPQPLYGRRHYHHVVMTPENGVLQRRIAAVQGSAGLWVTGMYAVDVDNHESALLSALPPVRALAPGSKNLKRLLAAVAPGAPHGLEVLPVPLVDREGFGTMP